MTKLYAQDIPETNVDTNVNMDVNLNVVDAILSASWVVQLTLLILMIFSILSWAVILMKYRQFQKAKQGNSLFLKLFWNSPSWDQIGLGYRQNMDSPAESVFRAGFHEFKNLTTHPSHLQQKQTFDVLDIESMKRVLRKASDLEITQLEFGLNLLATIGSTSPFIGLFGTVWGIMNAFQKIGITGSAHLSTVAPGISEALIATAFGLFVAIPAVIAYNQYLTQWRKIEIDLDHFQSDFLNVAKRHLLRRTNHGHGPEARSGTQ